MIHILKYEYKKKKFLHSGGLGFKLSWVSMNHTLKFFYFKIYVLRH